MPWLLPEYSMIQTAENVGQLQLCRDSARRTDRHFPLSTETKIFVRPRSDKRRKMSDGRTDSRRLLSNIHSGRRRGNHVKWNSSLRIKWDENHHDGDEMRLDDCIVNYQQYLFINFYDELIWKLLQWIIDLCQQCYHGIITMLRMFIDHLPISLSIYFRY